MESSQPQASKTFDAFHARLHEGYELSAYQAIERLVLAGEAVGLDASALLRLLDQGMTFERLLEIIESKMESKMAA